MQEFDVLTVDPDPIKQFQRWFHEAIASGMKLPEAMTLSTTTREGTPSARVVLLKHVDQRGFIFFTNYESRKGSDLADHPRAALVFYWPQFDRQVRIEGTVTKTSLKESEEYFQMRPRGSRIGAHASAQSSRVNSREELERRFTELEQLYDGKDIPCPPNWGGYCVHPERIEFWQGRENRLHDRILYERMQTGGWSLSRLAP